MRIKSSDIEWTVLLFIVCSVFHWAGHNPIRWWMAFVPLAIALAARQAN
jgi:hypothetical protein